jgi:hypothetical protein
MSFKAVLPTYNPEAFTPKNMPGCGLLHMQVSSGVSRNKKDLGQGKHELTTGSKPYIHTEEKIIP